VEIVLPKPQAHEAIAGMQTLQRFIDVQTFAGAQAKDLKTVVLLHLFFNYTA
jgi:hypothetical protein